jgi:hypothetical protein
MRKLLITLSLLMANNAYADSCIPKPDCADMGYKKTSCSGAYLKCPFDTSKMACLAEEVVIPQNCTVGMYYYTDKSCSSTYNSSRHC